MTDDLILAKKGDEEATKRLLGNIYEPLCAYVHYLLRAKDLRPGGGMAWHSAMDLASEIYFQLMGHIVEKGRITDADVSFRAIVMHFTKYRVLDHFRKMSKVKEIQNC